MSIFKLKEIELFKGLKTALSEIISKNSLLTQNIAIYAKTLTPIEAIGTTDKKDFPILKGKEIMLQAEFMGSIGQAFTDTPYAFEGNLKEILDLDLENNDKARGIFICTLNAVMSYLGLIDRTIHCKNHELELCAKEMANYIKNNYENPNIALIGFQPALLESLSKIFKVRILDLNSENIGKIKYNVLVEDGIKHYEEVVNEWADIILCTGSTLCNGSIVNFIDINKEVLFYGTTLAGAAQILGLKRVCFYSK